MKKLKVCSICNIENCREKLYAEEGKLNRVIYAEISTLKHSIHRINYNVTSDDRDVIEALSHITAGIEKLERSSKGSNREAGNSIEKKGLENITCSNCNKSVELTEKNCHSAFSKETEQIENYFFCKSCQKMITYKKK